MRIKLSAQLNSNLWAPLGTLFITAMISMAVYWPGLSGPMLFDDFPQLGQFFHHAPDHAMALGEVLWSNSGPLGRPVSMFTFWANSVLTPDDLAAWKLTNLIIHVLCGLLASLLAIKLFTITSRSNGIESRYLGIFVGTVWLLHPLQVSTVLYTVQRMTELAALFTFAGLYAFVLARSDQTASLRRAIAGLLALSIATVLAVFSKENGLLLPFLALAVELVLFRGAGGNDASRAVKYYFGSICLLTFCTAIVVLTLHPHFLSAGYAFRDFTLTQRLLSEPRILFDYLWMLVFPAPGHMGFFHDDIALSTGLLHPVTTLLSLLGLAALIISAWFARKRFPLYTLGAAIFLIGQSMESSFIALEPMFEHRNYLPCFGVFLGITDVIASLLSRRERYLRTTLASLAVLVLMILLSVRVMHWSSGLSFYTAAVKAHPNSEGAVSGLAQVYLDADRPELALQALSRHESLGTQLQRAYIECKMHGSVPDTQLEALISQPMGYLDSYPVTGLTTLGAMGIQNQCKFSDALYSRLIDSAATMRDTGPNLRYMLYIYSGYYHQRMQQLDAAVAAMQAAHRMTPDTPVPLILSARWYLEAGDPAQAEIQLDKASKIDNRYRAGFGDDIAQLRNQIRKTTGKSPDTAPR